MDHYIFIQVVTNDNFVFCEANENQVIYLTWFLAWFEALLGLRANLAKIAMILVGGHGGGGNKNFDSF